MTAVEWLIAERNKYGFTSLPDLLRSLKIEQDQINDIREIKVGDIVVEKLSSGFYDIFEIHTENDIDTKTQLKVIKPL